MSLQETKVIMNTCIDMFGYAPKTVAEFASFINFLNTKDND